MRQNGQPRDDRGARPGLPRDRAWLWPVLAGAAIRFVIAFAADPPHLSYDSLDYLTQSTGRASGGVRNFPLGYPALLALLPAGGDWRAGAAVVVNCALSSALIYLAWSLARTMGLRAGSALVAAWGVALWPHQINYARFVLSEVPAAVAVTGAALLLARRHEWAGGALGALAGTLRTSLLVVGPAWALLLRAPRVAAGWLLALATAVASFFVWQGHAGLGNNLAYEIHVSVAGLGGAKPADLSLTDAIVEYGRAARDTPGAFLQKRLDALWNLWGWWPTDDARRGPWRRAAIGMRFLLFLAGVYGLWRLRAASPAAGAGLIAVGLLTLEHTLLFAQPRHAVTIEPLLLVGAAAIFAARQRQA